MRTLSLVVGLILSLPVGVVVGQAPTDSTYTVQSGDTLYGIAREHGVSVRALRRWNDLDDTTLREGDVLHIRPPSEPTMEETTPAPSDPAFKGDTSEAEPARSDTARRPFGRHVVEAGETFITLALRLGTTADTLWSLNEVSRDSLSAGDVVRLPRRFGPPTHVVKEGETLYAIAGQYGASVRSIQAINDLETTELQPGQRLRLPMESERLNPPGSWAEADTVARSRVYPDAFAGRLMASGRTHNPEAFAVGHPTLPFGSVVLISKEGEARATFARVLDRGSPDETHFLQLSEAVADQLGTEPGSTPTVTLRVVWIAD